LVSGRCRRAHLNPEANPPYTSNLSIDSLSQALKLERFSHEATNLDAVDHKRGAVAVLSALIPVSAIPAVFAQQSNTMGQGTPSQMPDQMQQHAGI
jgi:hypothetical protein